MPNGHSNNPNYQNILAEYDVFFAPICDVLTNFSKKHNLLIQKYYHDAPMWSLCFRHPLGGQARIDASRSKDFKLTLSGVWWVDDFDKFTRSIKNTSPISCELREEEIEGNLSLVFKTILLFRHQDWSQVATGYKGIWDATWTKEQFEKLEDNWPFPS